jgi:hypothetical protein
VLNRVGQHPNRRHFILKSIILIKTLIIVEREISDYPRKVSIK